MARLLSLPSSVAVARQSIDDARYNTHTATDDPDDRELFLLGRWIDTRGAQCRSMQAPPHHLNTTRIEPSIARQR